MIYPKHYVVAGETAVGKSSFAIKLAKLLLEKGARVNIINGDSQQIIKELPVLSDQPMNDFGVPHFLYGYKSIDDSNSSFTWMQDVIKILDKEIISIIVGGSGFYLLNLIRGHLMLPKNTTDFASKIDEMHKFILERDPECKLPKTDRYRVARYFDLLKKTEGKEHATLIAPYNFYTVLLKSDKVEENITLRIERDFDAMIDEVRQCKYNSRFERILGFKEIYEYINKRISITEAKELMRIRIRQYAKRQRTWFKRMKFDFVGKSEDFFSKVLEIDSQ